MPVSDIQTTVLITTLLILLLIAGVIMDQVEKLGEDKDCCCFVIKKVRVERQL